MLPSDSKGRSGGSLVATDRLASKLCSLDCEPLCVENLDWSLPAGDNDDRRRTELPKLSRINSVRHNRRIQRMFQRRSVTDGFLFNERSSEDGPEQSSTRSVRVN